MKETLVVNTIIRYNLQTIAKTFLFEYLRGVKELNEKITYRDLIEKSDVYVYDMYGEIFTADSARYFISVHTDDAAWVLDSLRNDKTLDTVNPFRYPVRFAKYIVQKGIENIVEAFCEMNAVRSYYDEVMPGFHAYVDRLNGDYISPTKMAFVDICVPDYDGEIVEAYPETLRLLCGGINGEALDDMVFNNTVYPERAELFSSVSNQAACFGLLKACPPMAEKMFFDVFEHRADFDKSIDNPFPFMRRIESAYIKDRVLFALGADLDACHIQPVEINNRYDFILDDGLRACLASLAEDTKQIGLKTILKCTRNWER